ncbi:hypothetical protein PGTUg99_036515 [Puccinia graminis f. sp. tritici]|uniref:Uncharacterized protein n=1 Tax=Puccinia graminis f. sp. tritici TaxID=56615 RepID=A0A5B0N6Y7_PUCGR|nr:hypothetical protein PGTUg99_036515 [Puccinia graminis f. sp. tritici]
MINPKPSIRKKFSSPLYTTELHERRLRRWASARSYRTIHCHIHNQAPSGIASGCGLDYISVFGSMTGLFKIIPTGEIGQTWGWREAPVQRVIRHTTIGFGGQAELHKKRCPLGRLISQANGGGAGVSVVSGGVV